MAYRKLNIDWDKINRCRETAGRIVKTIQKYVDRHSTLSIESATLCICGVEEIGEKRHIANQVITKLSRDRMRRGVSYWFGQAMLHHNLKPRDLGIKIAKGNVSFEKLPSAPVDKIHAKVKQLALEGVKKIDEASKRRDTFYEQFASSREPTPLIMGLMEHNRDAKSFTEKELPHVIELKNLKGLTSAFQRFTGKKHSPINDLREKCKNFKKFAYSITGLETPKQTWESITAGADIVSHDPFKDILIKHINIKRACVDAHFTRKLCAHTGTTLYNEAAHVRNLNAYRESHQLLVSQFLTDQFGERAHLTSKHLALGHAFDVDPAMEDGFLNELARAAMLREIYARNMLVYLPSNFTAENLTERAKLNTLFNIAGMITEQSTLLIAPTANYHEILRSAFLLTRQIKTLGEEIQLNPHGKIARRAHVILENTFKTLNKIEQIGLFEAVPKGLLGSEPTKGKDVGLGGVFQKERDYFNPLDELLKKKSEEIYCVRSKDVTISRKEKQAGPPKHAPRPRRFSKFKKDMKKSHKTKKPTAVKKV